jgi:hypothetical protein
LTLSNHVTLPPPVLTKNFKSTLSGSMALKRPCEFGIDLGD